MLYHFKEPKDSLCISCIHIVDEKAPILFVSHEDDGEWQFLCGSRHHESEVHVLSLSEIVDIDPTVNELCEMQRGVYARRDFIGDRWTFHKE